ncbi:peptidoglycan-binding protein [Caenispirillum salinarum]|uniref:peptidoglycan-binding protein n=1 Tax=Caenispirillum salinarum TaxID=859058 RepID=UPI00384ADDFA
MRKTIRQISTTSLGMFCVFTAIFLSVSTAGAVILTPRISDNSGGSLIQKAAYDRTIEQIQRDLNRAGYEAGSVDGVLGSRTRDAIRAYQRDNGLPVTGQPDQELLDHMASSDAAETRSDQVREAAGSRGGSTQETIELPPDVIEGFYITLDDVRAKSDQVYDALAGAAGDPISKDDFVTTKLPDKVVPEDADRELLQKLFSVLDMNDDGKLTRAEWRERIESDLAFADENEDGKITLKELSRARENIGIGDALRMIF